MIYISVAVFYVLALAIIDALVNRLIFRENYSLSYFSTQKKNIYKRPEWLPYCMLMLIFLPIILPVIIAYYIGGVKYLLGYLLILTLVEWDMIFGKLIFNDWFEDLPSIRLPIIGWVHFKLWPTIFARLIAAIILFVLLTYL